MTKPPGDYEVGYGKPPKQHQFKRRQPSDAPGAARRLKGPGADVAALLDETVPVRTADGKAKQMHPHEAILRQLGKAAIGGSVEAIKKFLREARRAGLLEVQTLDAVSSIVVIPVGMPMRLGTAIVKRCGQRPWPEAIVTEERAKYFAWRSPTEKLHDEIEGFVP